MAPNPCAGAALHTLCSKYRAFFELIAVYLVRLTAQTNAETISFHNIEELELSARTVCHLCNLIVTEMSKKQIDELHGELRLHPERRDRQIEASVSVMPRYVGSETVYEGRAVANTRG